VKKTEILPQFALVSQDSPNSTRLVLVVLTNVLHVLEPLTIVPLVSHQEMSQTNVTAQQDNMKKMIYPVQIVTGNVLNVIQVLINVPSVEVTEP